MGDISLVTGWLPWVVIVLAGAVVLASLGWRSGLWRRELAWGAAISIGAVGLFALANRVLDLLPFSFPPSFYALFALIISTVTVALVAFRHDGVWRRLDALAAVVASALLLGVVVNGHYQYYPTVANVFGQVSAHERALPELIEIKKTARSTGRLPENGYTAHVEIPGTVSGFDAREAYVYLPPAYFSDSTPTPPVIMLLHGVPGGPADWLVGGQADKVADEFAARHDGKAPILVMPDVTGSDFNDTECTDSPRGKVETYLVTDVPTFMTATLGTETGGDSWGVAGLSMGGFCSLMLSLRHPTSFRVFGDYSGLADPELDPPDSALTELFGGNQQTMDAYDPPHILAGRRFEGLSGWFEVGTDDDAPLKATEQVADQARKAGVSTCVLIRPGAHDFDFWHAALEHSLPWMSAKLGLVPMPVDTHGADCAGS